MNVKRDKRDTTLDNHKPPKLVFTHLFSSFNWASKFISDWNQRSFLSAAVQGWNTSLTIVTAKIWVNRYVIAFEEHLGGARQTPSYHALHEYALQQVGSVTEQHSILILRLLFEDAVCIIQERVAGEKVDWYKWKSWLQKERQQMKSLPKSVKGENCNKRNVEKGLQEAICKMAICKRQYC